MNQHRMTLRRALPLGVIVAAVLSACSSGGGTARLRPGVSEPIPQRIERAQQLAVRAAKTEDPDKALKLYGDAVNAYSEFPAAWNNYGVLLMHEDRFLEAQEAFARASELDLADPRPMYNLGLLYDRRHHLRKARDYYERALQRDPNFLPALRGAIRADKLLLEGSDKTVERIDRALMLEQDERWREKFQLFRVRIETAPVLDRQADF